MMKIHFKSHIFIILIIAMIYNLLSCSISKTIPHELFKSDFPKKSISSFYTPTKVVGLLNRKRELVLFKANTGDYNPESEIVTGTSLEGAHISIHIDSLYAIRLKGLDYKNGMNVTPVEYKRQYKLEPNNTYNPYWDHVKVRSNSIIISQAFNSISGTTAKGTNFDIPLDDIEEISIKKFRYNNAFKLTRDIVSAYILYNFIFETKEKF